MLIFIFKKNYATGSLILFGFIVISLVGLLKFDYYQFLFLACVGLFLFRHVQSQKCKISFKLDLKQLAVAIFLALFAISISDYVGFNSIKSIAIGQIHHDTLFHTSIAAMLKNYGVPSTGLNGLIPIKYHIFSHMVFAGVSKMTGTSVFVVYSCFTKMFLIPLFFWVIINLLETSKYIQSNEVNKFLSIFTSTLILLNFLFKNFGLWFDSIFISESFLMSLVILIPFLSLTCLDNKNLFILLILTVVLSLTKISVGFIFLVSFLVYYYWNIRSGKFVLLRTLSIGFFFFFFFFLSINYFFIIHFGPSVVKLKINFFHFAESYTSLFKSNTGFSKQTIPFKINQYLNPLYYNLYFLMGHFVLIIVFLFIKNIYNFRFSNFFHVIIAISIVISIFVISIVEIPGGSAGYFSLVPNLLLLIYLSVLILKKLYDTKINFIILTTLSLILLSPGLFKINNFGWLNYQNQLDNSLMHNVKFLKTIRDNVNLQTIKNNQMSFYSLNKSNLSNYSKLFLFPAISEKCWKNILIDSAINYNDYGFEDYKLNNNSWK